MSRRSNVLIAGAAAVIAVIAVITIAVAVRPGRTHHQPSAASKPAVPAAACPVPAFGEVAGPAASALRGGAVTTPWSLDGGGLSVAPPGAAKPAVGANQAECTALASLDQSGTELGLAAKQGGVAIGYGRVTVAAAISPVDQPPASAAPGAGPPAATNPTFPAPATFHQRLAWVVVVSAPLVYSCPAMTAAPPRPDARSSAATAAENYAIFLLDAQTGSAALVYTPAHAAPCGGTTVVAASAYVPLEQISVPWTLVSRSPDGYSGRIAVSVLACDGHGASATVDYARPAVTVLVDRPVGAPCGPARTITVPLYAADVTADLPALIGHDPVGPRIGALPNSSGPGATGGQVRELAGVGGSTVTVPVGDVLLLPPPYDFSAAPAGASSNPSVLGYLEGSISDFRAWRPGTADLTLRACPQRAGAASCDLAYVVHVIVTP